MKTHLYLAVITVLCCSALSAEHHKEGEEPKGRPPGGPMHGKMLEMIDADKDGKISRQEWQKHHDARFTELDADKDGFITKEEMKAHHEKMMEKHGKMKPGGKGMRPGKKRPKKEDDDAEKSE